jgi:hypothetical protein
MADSPIAWVLDIFKLMGLIVLLIGIVGFLITKRKEQNRICTKGVVVGFKTKTRSIKGVSYDVCAAVVKYNLNNEEVTATDMNYTFKKALPYDVGATVDICYYANNKEKFYVSNNKIAPYVNSVTAIIAGVTIFVCGFVFKYIK